MTVCETRDDTKTTRAGGDGEMVGLSDYDRDGAVGGLSFAAGVVHKVCVRKCQ